MRFSRCAIAVTVVIGFAAIATADEFTYTDEQGKPGEPYKLSIKSAGDADQLKWEKGDQTPYFGVGIEVDGKLVIGWRPTQSAR